MESSAENYTTDKYDDIKCKHLSTACMGKTPFRKCSVCAKRWKLCKMYRCAERGILMHGVCVKKYNRLLNLFGQESYAGLKPVELTVSGCTDARTSRTMSIETHLEPENNQSETMDITVETVNHQVDEPLDIPDSGEDNKANVLIAVVNVTAISVETQTEREHMECGPSQQINIENENLVDESLDILDSGEDREKLMTVISVETQTEPEDVECGPSQQIGIENENLFTLRVQRAPVTTLNSIMCLTKNCVKYSEVWIKKGPNMRNFKFQAKCKNITAYGYGYTKIMAKRNAAFNFLKKISTDTATTKNTLIPNKSSSRMKYISLCIDYPNTFNNKKSKSQTLNKKRADQELNVDLSTAQPESENSKSGPSQVTTHTIIKTEINTSTTLIATEQPINGGGSFPIEYTMISKTNELNLTNYKYQAKCGNEIAYGYSTEENKAKQLSHYFLLRKMQTARLTRRNTSIPNMTRIRTDDNVNLSADANFNPLWQLHVICQRNEWTLPTYAYEYSHDVSTNLTKYVATCELNGLAFKGDSDVEKNNAKQKAALGLYNQLLSRLQD